MPIYLGILAGPRWYVTHFSSRARGDRPRLKDSTANSMWHVTLVRHGLWLLLLWGTPAWCLRAPHGLSKNVAANIGSHAFLAQDNMNGVEFATPTTLGRRQATTAAPKPTHNANGALLCAAGAPCIDGG